MGLNVKDLVENKVYYFDYGSTTKSTNYIARYIESKRTLINVSSNRFEIVNYNFWEDRTVANIREATQDEIDWLEACEKEGKFVDKPVKKEFIVGKWYKLNNSWYAKFKELYNNYFHFTELINSSGRYSKENSSTQAVIPIILLEDLSEIQQYLPKDHPDLIKITEFKKDDYIILLFDLNSNFKLNYCYKQRENSRVIRPYLDSNFNKGNGILNSFYENSNDWRYATKEEIEHYNQVNKPYDVTTLVKSEYLKPEELVEGCWYECLKYSLKWLFKFDKLGFDSINTLKAYKVSSAYKCETIGGFVTSDITNIKPASNEEVLKYFPDEKFDNKWIPQVGEYVIMENAGGWTYSPTNNGCLAIVTKINDKRDIGYSGKQKFVYGISGNIINSRNKDTSFWEIPIIGREGEIIVRKALPHEIPNNLSTTRVKAKTVPSELLQGDNSWTVTGGKPSRFPELKIVDYVAVFETTRDFPKPKNTRIQLFEEVSSNKSDELVKLTVKSKINKNK